MKPRAFLSYRHDFTAEIAAKDTLVAALNIQQNVELIFDKSVTEVGDCVIEFMDELIAARCVYLFISEDYFKSAYTLYELILISEHPAADKKIILPICLSSQMLSVYDFQQLRDYWDDNPEIHAIMDHLFRYQTASPSSSLDSEALWEKVEGAWLKLIFPYLNTLWEAESLGNVGSLINQSVAKLSERVSEESNAVANHHRGILKNQIARLLDCHPFFIKRLARELGQPQDSQTIVLVGMLVLDSSLASQSIGHINAAAVSFREIYAKDTIEWKDAFQDIQQICGYLLINCINPHWWFNHELELGLKMQQGVIGSGYTLEASAFVEVVISKELITEATPPSPLFKVDGSSGLAVPNHKGTNGGYDNMLFDGVSEKAVTATLLGKIHQDLVRSTSPPENIQSLIKEISERAASIKNATQQRPVYYIVSGKYLEALTEQDWFPEFQEKLKGKLQFICCNEDTMAGAGAATQEPQSQLLSSIANLLNIDRN